MKKMTVTPLSIFSSFFKNRNLALLFLLLALLILPLALLKVLFSAAA